MTVSKYFNMH